MKDFLQFGSTFFLRVIIPGAALVLSLAPLVTYFIDRMNIKHILSGGIVLTGVTCLALALGLLLSFLDETIYRIYEGYSWPKGIRNSLTNKLNDKVEQKYEEFKKLEKEENANKKIEKKLLREWLMKFPLKPDRTKVEQENKDEQESDDKPENEAILPTRLGNIIASYENYPRSRYNLSSVFYWSRFWLVLDHETRKEVNRIWAEADCVTYISFGLFWISLVYLFFGVLDLFNVPSGILGADASEIIGNSVSKFLVFKANLIPVFLLFWGFSSFLLSVLLYYLSLPLHVRNGQYYASIFDLYRKEVQQKLAVGENESDFWNEKWLYLKYALVRCAVCNEFYFSELEQCPTCSEKQSE